MLNLIDSIKHDMAQAIKAANNSDRIYHCTRIEVAALQLAQLLKTDYPGTYAGHLTVLLDEAFDFCQEMNGD